MNCWALRDALIDGDALEGDTYSNEISDEAGDQLASVAVASQVRKHEPCRPAPSVLAGLAERDGLNRRGLGCDPVQLEMGAAAARADQPPTQLLDRIFVAQGGDETG